MTKDEALKLALEALKQIDEAMPFPVAKLAQKVIKEALAQPEQEQFALKHRIAELEGAVIGLQAHRTWVGLTDEDVTWLCNTAKSHEQTWGMFVRTIEAKLKEKNT